MNEQAVLRQPFDLDTHKKTFINYLEVVIDRDGVVHYAVPSHQEFLIALACHTHGLTRDELNERCPREYYFDFLNWLLLQTGAVSVWSRGFLGEPNDAQARVLAEFVEHGLLHTPD